eukprot:4557473-Prorocentrum_lima.AAC.1
MRQAGGREGNVEPAAVDVHEEEAEGKKKPAHSIASVHSAYSRTLANTFLRLTQEQTDDPASTKPAPEEVMMQRCKFANAKGEKKGQKVSWTAFRNLASLPMMDAVIDCIMSCQVGPEKLTKLVEFAKDVLECLRLTICARFKED